MAHEIPLTISAEGKCSTAKVVKKVVFSTAEEGIATTLAHFFPKRFLLN